MHHVFGWSAHQILRRNESGLTYGHEILHAAIYWLTLWTVSAVKFSNFYFMAYFPGPISTIVSGVN